MSDRAAPTVVHDIPNDIRPGPLLIDARGTHGEVKMGGGDKSAERSGAVAILLYALSISEFMTGSGISDMDSELELSAVTAEMKPRLRRISDCFQTICACYSHLSSLRLMRSSAVLRATSRLR